MAALAFHVCFVTQQLWEAADAFRRCGYDFQRCRRYLRNKRRLQLFAKYLREVQCAESERSRGDNKRAEMSRGHKRTDGIDFAAIEASAEAFEVIDSFAAERRHRGSGVEEVDFLQAERQHADTLQELGDYEDIEEIAGLEDTTFYDYADSKLVYQSSLSPLLAEGDSLTFSGYINANCERFSINFIDDNDDVALHINPRLPQNYIVRNSRLRNTWGKEETSSPLPFSLHRGGPFTIQVLVTEGCYMISVNGHHFAEFAHRLDKKNVTLIEVKGDVEHVKMERADVTSYPERLEHSKPKDVFLDIFTHETSSADVTDTRKVMPRRWRLIYLGGLGRSLDKNETGLELPYYGSMPAKVLSPGRCVRIVGRVKLLPHSFYINLQQGCNIWPHPTIAFHFNPRFSKHGGTIGQAIVCRNAWFNGGWGEEQRSELNTNFLPGKTFVMVVDCNTSAFDVYVNGKLITSFAYQVDPAVVDTVYVQGDIKLWNVVVERSDKHRANLFENPNYQEEDN